MPNEFTSNAIIRNSSARRVFRHLTPPVHPALVTIPGAEALPTYRGRTLYLPLYRLGQWLRGRPRSRPNGLGYVDIGGLLSVGASTISAADGFLETFAAIASTVGQVVVAVIQNIVEFIVNTVVAVVSAVLKAVGGLLGAVMDALGMKGDGDLGSGHAAELAALLGAKANSLSGADGKLERPMTDEERAAYERNLAESKNGISALAGGIVNALGGPMSTMLVGAAAAGIIYFGGRR